MHARVNIDRDEIAAFCLKWRIRDLSLFGSVLREDFGPESDLDFLVSFAPDAPLDFDHYLDVKEALEAWFGRSVDLVEKEALRNPWRKHEIMRTREVLHAA